MGKLIQENFFDTHKREHGVSLSIGRRRSKRPLPTNRALHVTSRSAFAYGRRAFIKNEALILSLAEKWSARFKVKVHIQSLNGNHIHYLVQGRTQEGIRNFLRVFLGQVAQILLKHYPLGGASGDASVSQKQVKTGCKKNQRTFWETLVYTRVISHGREYKRVFNYIIRNILETLNIWAYQPRPAKREKPKYPL